MISRALELSGIRILRTDWDSPMWRSLDPVKNLNFQYLNGGVTVLWLAVKKDPIYLAASINTVKRWIKESGQLFQYLSLQYCYDSKGLYDIDAVLPSTGRWVNAKDWGHLFAHLSLIHAHFTASRSITYMFEDRVFYNPVNKNEVCVVYNYPTRVGELGAYLEHVQNFLQSLLTGRPDHEFLNWMEAHRFVYDQWAENKKQPTRTTDLTAG